MYPGFLSNVCKQLLYRSSSNITFQINKFSYFTKKKNEKRRKVETSSMRFPGYQVIYVFPYIKFAGTLNAIKYKFSYFTGAVIPVIVALELINVISFDAAVASAVNGIILTLWLQISGIPCNNLIGYIYLNPDEHKMILSYIDYKGKRIDLETTPNKIIPFSNNPTSIIDPLYRKILFFRRKEILKINLQLGQIIDVENFKKIF